MNPCPAPAPLLPQHAPMNTAERVLVADVLRAALREHSDRCTVPVICQILSRIETALALVER